MRTGITFSSKPRTRNLLHDMNRRARLQMRLQRIVQGLSVAALAYYLLGLTALCREGRKTPAGRRRPDRRRDDALSVPLVFLASWLFMARVQRLSLKAAERKSRLTSFRLARSPAMHKQRSEDGETDGHDGDQRRSPIGQAMKGTQARARRRRRRSPGSKLCRR